MVGVLSLINIVLLCYGFRETLTEKTLKIRINARIILKPIVFLSIFALLAHEFVMSLFMQVMPIILVAHFHYSTTDISLFAALAGLVMAISVAFVLPKAITVLSIKQYLLTCLSLMLLAVTASFLLHIEFLYWMLMVLIIFGGSQSYVFLLTLFSSAADTHHQGFILGVSTAVLGLSWTISAIANGLLTMRFGYYSCLVVAIFFALLGILCVSIWFKRYGKMLKTA